MVGLDLDADLVILSACNSGGPGGSTAGESLSGLARAFFFAGARSLLVTHWSVNDQVAAYLVADTLRRMRDDPSAGRRRRRCATRSSRCWTTPATALPAEMAHPFFWAPFAVIGEGGGRVRGRAARRLRNPPPGGTMIRRTRGLRAWRRLETLGKYEIKRHARPWRHGHRVRGLGPASSPAAWRSRRSRCPTPTDPETAEEIARFRREAQAAGRLTHPNIVGVYDYGETADIAYIVMEFVDGPSLKALLDKQERFALPDILRVMEDLLAGLQFSHERGVVHRDIKPANVMLTRTGQAKIADFGIARIESSSMTQAGTDAGHAGLHVARAVHGPGGRCAHRRLFRRACCSTSC